MASITETARVTGAAWVDLDVGAVSLTIQNRGQREVSIVVDTSAPADSVYAVDAIRLLPGSDPIYLVLESGDNVYARVCSAHDAAKSTIAWHETTPPA